VELAGLRRRSGTELGEVISGAKPGRLTAEEITVYKSMGHAMEDMVAANLVYREALGRGAGRAVTL
jgi:ornithine cyclodeaminase/alanine dehydrogenase-like protein (mu-crystallin family)